jgi:hypothetical protein|tara:strand:- start:3131 stop:3886 length:756 start_codon:yes stop_codon:yes gene_type:complete
MSDEFEEEIDRRSGMELWLSDLSTDSATRNLGAFLIALGSILGVIVGIMLISGNVSDILSGEIDDSGAQADVNGIVTTALVDNTTGADPAGGVEVIILDDLGIEIGSDVTDSGGRFSITDLPRRSSTLEVAHPGNVTIRILLIPGDYSQISVTLTQGEGIETSDIRGDSHLGESVLIGTLVALLTLFSGLAGFAGSVEARKGLSYRRTWWLSFIGLWSRGMMFIGPLMILSGMGLVSLSRNQFYDVHSKEE